MERIKTGYELFIRKISAPFLLFAFILIFFGKESFPVHQNFIGGLDVAEYFYWHAHFIREQIRAGSLPLWNPYYYSGHPFLANPQTFIFYPSTLFFIIFPLPWAFNLDTILHLLLAALGMFYFVHLLTHSKSAGIGGGLIYALSGYFMDNVLAGHLTMIHTAALLPWIFYFFEKGYLSGRAVFFSISGFILGLQVLSGEPQNNFYTALFLTFFWVTRLFIDLLIAKRLPLYRLAMYFCLIPIVGIGTSMAQILPSLEFLSLSDRARNTFEFATNWSFPPRNFFTFLVPKPETPLIQPDWEFAGYFGIFGMVLAGIGAFFSTRRLYTGVFSGMLLLSAAIMLGRYTFIYRIFYEWFPGFSIFRIPARCLVIFVFLMAVLAGFGIGHLSEKNITQRQRGLIILGMILLFTTWRIGGKVFHIPMLSKGMILAAGLMACASLLFIIIPRIRNRRLIVAVFVAFLFTDPYLNYQHQTPVLNQKTLLNPFPFEVTLQKDPGLYRVAVPKWQLRGMKFDNQGINGYTPINFDSYFYFIHTMADIPIPQERRQKLSPRLFQPDSVFSSRILGIKYAVVPVQKGHQLLMNHEVFPRSILVKESLVIPQREDHIQFLKNPNFNPRQTVLLETTPPPWPPSLLKKEPLSEKKDRVEITHYSANRIELKSSSNDSGYLLLSELYYPGWKARVDGKEVTILRANYLLRAIPLPPGEHEIVFQFQPLSFYAGASISIATVLVLTGFGLFSMIQRKRGRLINLKHGLF